MFDCNIDHNLGRKTGGRLCSRKVCLASLGALAKCSQLIRAKQTLWTSGSAFPKTGSQVLSCPFQFQLPENLHPSFHYSSESTFLHAGAISYSLEVIAERHGRLHANHQIRRLISVVPAATPEQLLTRESLREGWTGQWRDIIQEKKIRQGFWGDYSDARAIVRFFLLTKDLVADLLYSFLSPICLLIPSAHPYPSDLRF